MGTAKRCTTGDTHFFKLSCMKEMNVHLHLYKEFGHFGSIFDKRKNNKSRLFSCPAIQACLSACLHACMDMHKYMHACLPPQLGMHVCLHACLRACMHACLYASMPDCRYACMELQKKYFFGPSTSLPHTWVHIGLWGSQ